MCDVQNTTDMSFCLPALHHGRAVAPVRSFNIVEEATHRSRDSGGTKITFRYAQQSTAIQIKGTHAYGPYYGRFKFRKQFICFSGTNDTC